tara:strand:+ start:2821 stop:3546 length:726 start_codon:yes stop_codon:yes gene_type:complete
MNNRFVFIMPAFNAQDTVSRSILSVWFQTYPNWKILIRDDVSSDNTFKIVENLKNQIGITDEKISIKKNTDKKWEVANILDMLDECDSSDIICRLDADDWLCDCDTLTILNDKYEKLKIDALWTSHRWSFSNQNISDHLPKNADPYTHPWVSSHLKTFRKYLIEGVNDKNFRGEDGEYFKRIGDQAIYLPVLHQSKGNWHFEPIVSYHYTIKMQPETFQTEDAKFQRDEGVFLRQRGFINN